jgi:hypothetical protein
MPLTLPLIKALTELTSISTVFFFTTSRRLIISLALADEAFGV